MTIRKTALLAAIATISLSGPAFAADLTSIGMTVGNLGNPFFLSMQKGAQAKANELAGGNVEVTAVSSDYDLNKQSTQIDNFIASGVDMVLLNAADPTAIEPAMVRLKAAGITSVALDVTAKGADAGAVWQSSRNAAAATPAPPKAKASPAKTRTVSVLPGFVEPQLCKTLEKPPKGEGWAHEIKFDGYRMQLRSVSGTATLLTRKGLDWSAKFAAIVRAGAKLPDGIIDGEVCALDHTGAPDFAALQAAISDGRTDDLVFFVFDQMFAGQEDLRPQPLSERKARLQLTVEKAPAIIRYVDHFVTAGEAVLQSACRMDLEGIISKKLDAPYQSGRSESWAKSKCRQGHEVVIGGWTTTGDAFRSLIAGVHRGGELVHVGRIGTGFGRGTVERLMPKLRALETDRSPFSGKDAPKKAAGVHWVEPELVAEIEYAGFTGDGSIRQASFKGLREDKPATEVEAETPAPASTPLSEPAPGSVRPKTITPRGSAPVMGITISHADKPLWPDANDGSPVTKLDLARYYEAVGPWMMEHLKGRPCSMIRMPDGINGDQKFFQRHTGKGQSVLITEVEVWGDRKPYIQFDRVEALVAAAQTGALELHPWNSEPFVVQKRSAGATRLIPINTMAAETRRIAHSFSGKALDQRQRLHHSGSRARALIPQPPRVACRSLPSPPRMRMLS